MRGFPKPHVCVSISGITVPEIMSTLRGLEMAEIRLDGVKMRKEDIKKVFSAPLELIATYRPGKRSNRERAEFLALAIEGGASYVDIEIESKKWFREQIMKRAREKGCKVILSYHNYQVTPSDSKLREIIELSHRYGGDITKIACKTNSFSDNARLLGLLGLEKDLVVIGMGEKGKITRVVAPILGSPFTYASLSTGMETADGQIEFNELNRLIGSLM